MQIGDTVTYLFNTKVKGIIVDIKEELRRAKVKWHDGTDVLFTCHSFNDLIVIEND